MGWKPILNTNGVALTEPLLRELKKAGLFGITFHVDTTQRGQRKGVRDASETDLNALRLEYARMVAKVGGIACSFNATISDANVHEVPALMEFARRHASVIHSMIFILFRSPVLAGDFVCFANGQEIQWDGTYESTQWGGKRIIMSDDVQQQILKADPVYRPCAYLNGTANPSSLKWLLGTRVVLGGKVLGWVPPKFMELVQAGKHFFTGTYFSYARPGQMRKGKLVSFLTGLIIGKMMRIWLKSLLRTICNPLNLFRHAHMQAVMIIQPVTVESDGRQDMCDACPDITVYEGKLLWSCRLEEVKKFGQFVEAVPKSRLRRRSTQPVRSRTT